MSLKTLLMPVVSAKILARSTLLGNRAKAEQKRIAQGRPHVVNYFHQVDDPYSYLVAQVLPQLQQRYSISIKVHLVRQPADAAAPERDKLIAWSRKDAAILAKQYGLDFVDQGAQPSEEALSGASAAWLSAIKQESFVSQASEIGASLWSRVSLGESENGTKSASIPDSLKAEIQGHIKESTALRAKLGHYLGGVLYYEGEWYWGVDRLYHLESRLQDLGLAKGAISVPICPPRPDLDTPMRLKAPAEIDFFFSFRSPYSAIVADRVFKLGELTGAKVNLRFVLPMVMRGLPVPKDKRQYIASDTAREAFVRGIPFGRINDPVGRPTERGLSLIPYAQSLGRGQQYVSSFMKLVWSEGVNAGSNRGLKRIVEHAGLDWAEAQKALAHTAWRETAEANRRGMFRLGLWGVPSFCVDHTAVWGQDRLWCIEDTLLNAIRSKDVT